MSITLQELKELYREYKEKHNEKKYMECVQHFVDVCKVKLKETIIHEASCDALISYESIGLDRAIKQYNFFKTLHPLEKIEYDIKQALENEGFNVEFCRPHSKRRDNDPHIRVWFLEDRE